MGDCQNMHTHRQATVTDWQIKIRIRDWQPAPSRFHISDGICSRIKYGENNYLSTYLSDAVSVVHTLTADLHLCYHIIVTEQTFS